MRRSIPVLLLCGAFAVRVSVEGPHAGGPIPFAGLRAAAHVTRDSKGIAHVQASNRHDLYLLQGYVHAQDRFFQMDFSRRQASGTLAELLGPSALATDVELRTIGIRRAAERSFSALSPRARAALTAYAEGVNAFLASNPLPPEYGALEMTHAEPWTALDSAAVAKLIAFGLSFDLSDIDLTVTLGSYEFAGGAAGFDGRKLFFDDLFRSEPFDPAATIPDSSRPPIRPSGRAPHRLGPAFTGGHAGQTMVALARRRLASVDGLPLVRRYFERDRHASSNEWAVSGRLTTGGFAMLANDPHLALGVPATWYPIGLNAGPIDVVGNGFAGVPFVILGHNRRIAWGATKNPMDVTDVFQEQIVLDPTSPSQLSSVHAGQNEPIIPVPQVFRTSQLGDGIANNLVTVPPGGPIPAATLIVPRRNNGPIIQLGAVPGPALSVQYTGFAPTRELDAFMMFTEARGLDDFVDALRWFDVGSQNFAYADVQGNIAYFTSGEMPIREDLQAGFVDGLPPFFIRNGVSGNEWVSDDDPPPDRANRFEILPFPEMPHTINPRAGFFVNANNDPTGATLDNDPLNQLRPGGGIYYLNPGYDGFRAGRATALIRRKLARRGALSFRDMQEIQADTVMIDAGVFVPHILTAFARARRPEAVPALAALGLDPGIEEAVNRLARWDFSTPTGIPEGYDATDVNGALAEPSGREIASSVAATLYSVWRAQFVAKTIDAPLVALGLQDHLAFDREALSALRHLLETFDESHGVGHSGLNFFNVPEFPPPTTTNAGDRRDFLILKSLADALGRLAGPSFAAAFQESANQDDYRWGKLHRIVFGHVLDGPFSIPPAGGAFPPALAGLPGIPTDGGFQTLDRADHPLRADTVNGFMFVDGSSHRSVHEARHEGVRGVSSLPGGSSGVLGSPFYLNLLPPWLTNEAYPLDRESGRHGEVLSVTTFVPARN